MRIAQIAPLWAPVPPRAYGGIELVVSLLAEELVRRGHEVTLFATGDSRTSAKLVSVCEQNILDAMRDGAVTDYNYYAAANLARAWRNAANFDVMHVHLGNQWIPFGTVTQTPALFTLHTQPSSEDAWVIADHPEVAVAAISRFQADSISAQRKIPVVYNGCDFESFMPEFAPGKYAAFFGRMSHQKNPLDAIRIARRAGMPIVLGGVAQNAKEERYFKNEIEPLIDGVAVKYLGALDHAQKNEFLRNAAVLISPVQWAEPFGLAMIEAMACGTPVLARNLGSIAEIIDPGETGFFANSIEELDALLPQTLELDRKLVREKARSRFDCLRMADEYLALYSSLT